MGRAVGGQGGRLGAGVTPVTIDHPGLQRVKDWIWTLPPPAYPFAVDESLAARGEGLYRDHCAACHADHRFKQGFVDPSWKVGQIEPIEKIGTDPFRLMPVFLEELKRIGFSGVQNFPTVGLLDGLFRINLEETGMGYGLEVDAIRTAHELDLLTAPYVFSDADATAMAEAGADVLVPHMGLTTGGSIGAGTAKTLDECVPLIQGMHDAARRVNPDIIVLCHGGPIAEPDDAAYILERTEGIVGFFGASSMERLPTEVAMTENMRRFKAIPVK
jgi:hypothetical protein